LNKGGEHVFGTKRVAVHTREKGRKNLGRRKRGISDPWNDYQGEKNRFVAGKGGMKENSETKKRGWRGRDSEKRGQKRVCRKRNRKDRMKRKRTQESIKKIKREGGDCAFTKKQKKKKGFNRKVFGGRLD